MKIIFLEILAIHRNLQNNNNMMSTTFSKEIFNQNNNVQRVEIREMGTLIQSTKKSQIDIDVNFNIYFV